MPHQDFTTFMLSLPEHCKDFSDKGIILFTIPVSPHAYPRCHELISRIHDYRRQPLKTSLMLHTRKQIIYRKRRDRCLIPTNPSVTPTERAKGSSRSPAF